MRLLLGVLGIMLFLSGVAEAQGTKIGYIDLQRVIRDSKAGKVASASFESEVQNKVKIIESKQKQLESMRTEFFQNAQVMNDTTRLQKAEQIEKLEKELKRTWTDFRDDLQKREFELTQRIYKSLQGILANIGKSENYTIILEQSNIVYGDPSADITQKVIRAYDAGK